MASLLEVKDLSLGYDAPLLQGLSFEADPGEIIGILGRNGCGKTTLLRGLSGSIRRFSGEVLVQGRDCARLNPRQRAALISVLPQHTQLLAGIHGRQLVEMGRYPYGGVFRQPGREDAARIEKNAELLGISHLLDRDCVTLSQGQQQLVLLCRLLTQDTPVMLLDEPNAALDYDNTFTMFRILHRVVQENQKTALLVLHDPELALAHCHRLLILKDGKLCCDLNPAQVGQAAVESALRQIYPHVLIRKDPFDGHFRCYSQSETQKERSLC